MSNFTTYIPKVEVKVDIRLDTSNSRYLKYTGIGYARGLINDKEVIPWFNYANAGYVYDKGAGGGGHSGNNNSKCSG